jgi:hypothetical protein
MKMRGYAKLADQEYSRITIVLPTSRWLDITDDGFFSSLSRPMAARVDAHEGAGMTDLVEQPGHARQPQCNRGEGDAQQ